MAVLLGCAMEVSTGIFGISGVVWTPQTTPFSTPLSSWQISDIVSHLTKYIMLLNGSELHATHSWHLKFNLPVNVDPHYYHLFWYQNMVWMFADSCAISSPLGILHFPILFCFCAWCIFIVLYNSVYKYSNLSY